MRLTAVLAQTHVPLLLPSTAGLSRTPSGQVDVRFWRVSSCREEDAHHDPAQPREIWPRREGGAEQVGFQHTNRSTR